ncbi:MAG: AsmA family protein, partial [Pseudomonadota bacterium]
MRKALIAGGGVVAVGLTILAAPYLIDWDWVKPIMLDAAEDATGYDIDVSGAAGFTFFPSPRVSVEGVTVAGFGADAAPLATADRLAVEVAFWSLLQRQVEVQEIILVRPSVRLVSYADGTGNWQAPGTAETEEADADGGDGLSIAEFRIEDGELMRVGETGETLAIDNINLDLSLAEQIQWAGTLSYDDRPVAIAGTWREDGRLALDGMVGEALTYGFVGRVDTAAAQATGRISLSGETLGDAIASVSGGADAEPQAPAYAAPFELSGRLDLTGDAISMDDLAGTVAGTTLDGDATITLDGRTDIRARLALGDVDLAGWQGGGEDDAEPDADLIPDDMSADLVLSIAALQYGDIDLGGVTIPLTLADGIVELGRVLADLPAGGAALLAGRLLDSPAGPAFSGQFDLRLPRPAATLGSLGIRTLTAAPAIAAKGRLESAGDGFGIRAITGTVGGADFRGEVVLPAGEAPMEIALRADALDLDAVT